MYERLSCIEWDMSKLHQSAHTTTNEIQYIPRDEILMILSETVKK